MVPKEKKISFDGDLIGKMVPAKWKIREPRYVPIKLQPSI